MKLSTRFRVLCAILCSSVSAFAQNVIIPDSNFKAALVANAQINRNGDGEIQMSEATSFTGIINVPNQSIEDLTGIEAFTNLTRLYCNNNLLTSLNVSQNSKLVALRCNNNALTALDVSNNTMLTDLRCYVNNISDLDVTTLVNLEVFHVFQNDLTNIGLSNNTKLRELKAAYNELEFLNLNDNVALTYLDVKQNALTTLMVANRNNANMTYFNAVRNMDLLCIEVDNVQYSEQNWTNVEAHSYFSIFCAGDNEDIVSIPDPNFKAVLLANKDINVNGDREIQGAEARSYGGSIFAVKRGIGDLTGIERFTELRELHVYENDISSIDLSRNTELRVLRFNDNPVSFIDLSVTPHLTSLLAHNTPLTSLDLSGNPELTTLWCFDSQLTSLDLTNNTALVDVQVNHNKLTYLTLGSHPSLTTLLAYQNQLTSIDISQATAIRDLRIQQNKLTSIDITDHSALITLNVGDNMLTVLEVNAKPNLRSLSCYNNQIVSLDISQAPGLFSLLAYKNKLTGLNVKNGNNTSLRGFDVTRNPDLTCIQVDDAEWSEANWTNVDAPAYFSENCSSSDPNIVYIPDPNLKRLLVSLVDGNSDFDPQLDGEVQYEEAINFYGEINASDLEIRDMTGIGAFDNAGFVDCSNNLITRIDEVPSVADGGFDCSNNQITEISVSLTHLTYFKASYNRLTTLPALNYLSELHVDHNELTSIAMSSENYIHTIHAEFNQIESFDFGPYHSVRELYINDNKLTSMDIPHSDSSNYPITALDVGNNELTSLNIQNGANDLITTFNAIGNPNLTCIQVDDPAQAEADWRDNVDPQASFSEDCSAEAFSMAASPNPTMGRLSIESTRPVDEVQIIDGVSGDLKATSSGAEIDISGLQNGVYLVRVRSGEKVMMTRVVKQ